MQTIPVYFTFDRYYVIAAAVAIYSLLKNASTKYTYKLYVLHSDIEKKEQDKLINLTSKFTNASLEFINVSAFDSGWDKLKNKSYFSKEIFNKLIAAEVFPQYDRIICSDVDVVFTGDISESYFMYQGEHFYYAGVRPILKNNSIPKYNANFTNGEIEILKKGISGGYLLINLKKIREDNIQEKMTKFYISNLNRLYLPEQDCIMLCCYPHVKYLPFNYVVCMFFYTLDLSQIEFNEDIEEFASNKDKAIEQFNKALHNPIQIHYVGFNKPWNSFFIPKWKLWMDVLIKTQFIGEYIKIIPSFFYKKLRRYSLKRFLHKWRQRISKKLEK